jgi:hypothetical protein
MDPAQIQNKWEETSALVKSHLGTIEPVDSVKTGSFFWENKATTVDELHKTAVQTAPDFLVFLRRVASDVAAKACNEQYVVKNEASLAEKVNNRMKWASKNSVAYVNDALRGTIIVKDMHQAKQLIQHLTQSAGKCGHKVAFSNKFEANYENGYVGIHARLLYNTPDGNQILAEVQIHFETIENGTPECPSQHTHKAYEIVRQHCQGETLTPEANEMKNSANLASRAEFTLGMSELLKGVIA